MRSVSQTLLTNNPTWAAQKKEKVLISILQRQTLFSGKITLQQSALYSESCSVPAAPTALALEAQLCLGGGSEGRIQHTEAQRFCREETKATWSVQRQRDRPHMWDS